MKYLLCYTVLSGLTFIIAALALQLYSRTKHLGFPAGIGLIYYWSLWGAWFLVYDKSVGAIDTRYEIIQQMLFRVHIDQFYIWTLLLYGTFIIALELTLLMLTQNHAEAAEPEPLVVSHGGLLILVLAVGSVALVMGAKLIIGAMAAGSSVYDFRNGKFAADPLFGIFSLVIRTAVLLSMLGFALAWCGRKGRLIKSDSSPGAILVHGTVLLFFIVFNFVLGAKSLIFGAGISMALFFLGNIGNKAIGRPLVFGASGLVVLGLIDVLRGTPVGKLGSVVMNLSLHDITHSLKILFASNEAYAAHFSMYGALLFDIPKIYGGSLINLILVLVPRAFWADRPDTYDYYAHLVGADPSSGFSIHHATAWYLNFGTIGVIAGAVFLGWVWSASFNASRTSRSGQGQWMRVLAVLGPWLIVGLIPQLIRAGIEGYKFFFLGGIFLPVTLLWMTSSSRFSEFFHRLVFERLFRTESAEPSV